MKVLVWWLVEDGGAGLWSDREGEGEKPRSSSGPEQWSLAAFDGIEVGYSGGDQQIWEVRVRERDAGGVTKREREKILIEKNCKQMSSE
jgi:hypothetical protein